MKTLKKCTKTQQRTKVALHFAQLILPQIGLGDWNLYVGQYRIEGAVAPAVKGETEKQALDRLKREWHEKVYQNRNPFVDGRANDGPHDGGRDCALEPE